MCEVQRLAFTVKEAAQAVGMGETKFRELLHRDVIPSKKVGRLRLVPAWALQAWLDETTPAEENAAWPFQKTS